jgi:phage-related minor tail protein
MTDQQRREKQTERPYPEHGACTGPCCAPELWAAGIKGSGQAGAPPVAHHHERPTGSYDAAIEQIEKAKQSVEAQLKHHCQPEGPDTPQAAVPKSQDGLPPLDEECKRKQAQVAVQSDGSDASIRSAVRAELIAEQADKRKFILETERLNRDLDTANHALADARAELEEANSLYANLITELRGELSIARAELEEAQAHEATTTRDNLKLAQQLIHAKVELAAATQKIARYEAVDKHEDDKHRDRI